jgi:phage gp16-like protein
MKPLSTDALRKSELAKIHIAKKQLALDDGEYRALMLAVTGQQSAADLDWQGRKNLLDHFKKLGFKVKSKAGGRIQPRVAKDRMPRMRKIGALLAEAKLPWSYADGIAKKLFKREGIERIEFCDGAQLSDVIAALVLDAKRRARKAVES